MIYKSLLLVRESTTDLFSRSQPYAIRKRFSGLVELVETALEEDTIVNGESKRRLNCGLSETCHCGCG
jgi:hypothetical protein